MSDINYAEDQWFRQGRGPRYQQFARFIAGAIRSGALEADTQIPPERDLAELTKVSRVTIRKSMSILVDEGLIDQRQGAGSFVRPFAPKAEQTLSSIVSFTENMAARGKTSTSVLLDQGTFWPTPDESVVLGLSTGDPVSRVNRLRSADGVPMAIERSSVPTDILPKPSEVNISLYAVLRRNNCAPTRAIQRVTATSIDADEARLLNLKVGDAALLIERTGYLASGRPIEFTRGIYRPDLYDFVTELRLEDG